MPFEVSIRPPLRLEFISGTALYFFLCFYSKCCCMTYCNTDSTSSLYILLPAYLLSLMFCLFKWLPQWLFDYLSICHLLSRILMYVYIEQFEELGSSDRLPWDFLTENARCLWQSRTTLKNGFVFAVAWEKSSNTVSLILLMLIYE